MFLDPSQIAGHISVDTGLVAVTTARAPADDASKDEPVLCRLIFAHQRAPGVTLVREHVAQPPRPVPEEFGGGTNQAPGLTWHASVPPSRKPAQSIPERKASPCTSGLEQRSEEIKGTCASCRKLEYSSAPANTEHLPHTSPGSMDASTPTRGLSPLQQAREGGRRGLPGITDQERPAEESGLNGRDRSGKPTPAAHKVQRYPGCVRSVQ